MAAGDVGARGVRVDGLGPREPEKEGGRSGGGHEEVVCGRMEGEDGSRTRAMNHRKDGGGVQAGSRSEG